MMPQVQLRIKGKIYDQPGFPFDLFVYYYVGEEPFVISFTDKKFLSRKAALQALKIEVKGLAEHFGREFGGIEDLQDFKGNMEKQWE